MDYANENWIKVYTRDTASWKCLSVGARGLSYELSRAMGRFTDEIRLGARGLKAVAALVGAPWEEVEPLLTELLRDGRLEYHPDEQILRDTSHLVRQGVATSPAQRKRDSRAKTRKVTPSHVESREVTPSHDQIEEIEETEERETRAHEDVAEAPEPVPSQRLVTDKPPWFAETVDTAEMSTGETFDRGCVWTTYLGSRTADGRPLSAPDLLRFLGSWANKQKDQRVREAARPPPLASGPRLHVVAPAPYHATTADDEREQWEADASSPEAREAALEASRRLLAGLG